MNLLVEGGVNRGRASLFRLKHGLGEFAKRILLGQGTVHGLLPVYGRLRRWPLQYYLNQLVRLGVFRPSHGGIDDPSRLYRPVVGRR